MELSQCYSLINALNFNQNKAMNFKVLFIVLMHICLIKKACYATQPEFNAELRRFQPLIT